MSETGEGLLPGAAAQVAVVVHDIERAAAAYAELLGVEAPKIIETEGPEKSNVRYRGRPTDARAKLAFFDLGPISLELIEPIGGPSVWRDHLDRHGEGIHHVAFRVGAMDEALERLAARGAECVQTGAFPGGRYAYVDGAPAGLGALIELLEHAEDRGI